MDYKFSFILGLVLILLFISSCEQQKVPSCGDGIWDEGETGINCCIDTGCSTGKECVGLSCQWIECGECQTMKGSVCVDDECCTNDDCNDNEFCVTARGECMEVGDCGECSYIENHQCQEYECCSGDDCVGGRNCIDPETTESQCSWLKQCDLNADCDDGKGHTKDNCVQGFCENKRISKCINDDNYCPDWCTFNDDNDCENEFTDCGNDIDCFIATSYSCTPSTATSSITFEIFGVLETVDYAWEIFGRESSKCVVKTEYLDIEMEYTDEVIQDLLNEGKTQEEIDQQEQEVRDGLGTLIGKSGTCKYPGNVWGDTIRDFKDGDISGSTEDVKKYECTGSMYENMIF